MSIQEDLKTLIPAVNEDAEDELFVEVRTDTGTSWYLAVFLVVNAALGAGLLNFPQAYDQAGGILVAVIIQAVLIGFVLAALLILAKCSDLNRSATYQDVVLGLCGKRAQQACAFGVILYCYGTCITFLIIIGDQFDRVLASLYGSEFCHFWYMNRAFTITLSSVLLILPLCFSRRIDFLKYPSSVGVLAILYVVFLIVYQYYTADYIRGDVKTRPDTWTDVFTVVPVICFGYQCHISVVPIYACLQPRTIPAFTKTVVVAILVCALVYTAAATFGYLTFGSLVPSDILEAYNAKDPIVLVGIIALALKIFTTYPILLFCGRVAVEGLIVELFQLSQTSVLHGECRRRVIIGLVWFSSSVALSVIVPNISDVISLLGSLAAVFIFVFPGCCWIKATFLKDPNLVLLKDRLIVCVGSIFIVIGAFLFGVVLTQAIQEDVGNKGKAIALCL